LTSQKVRAALPVTPSADCRGASERSESRISKAILLNARRQLLTTLKTTLTSVDVGLRGLPGQNVTVHITTKPRSSTKTAGVTRTYVTCLQT
jgi:hypothetical protein